MIRSVLFLTAFAALQFSLAIPHASAQIEVVAAGAYTDAVDGDVIVGDLDSGKKVNDKLTVVGSVLRRCNIRSVNSRTAHPYCSWSRPTIGA